MSSPLLAPTAIPTPDDPSIREFSANALLFSQDSTASRAYRILRGRVRLFRETGLKRIVVDEVGVGSIVGFHACMQGERYALTAETSDRVEVQILVRDEIQGLLQSAPPVIADVIRAAGHRETVLLKLAQAPSVEQTFLGICRGVDLLLPPKSGPQPESHVLSQLRDLFGLPMPIMRQAIHVLADLNLVHREQSGGLEATLEVRDRALVERARGLVDRWVSSLPALLRKEAPREPYTLDELSDEVGAESQTILRRLISNDFPTGLLRFDAEGINHIRQAHGDNFFRKKVTSKDLITEAQSIDELTNVDPMTLREFVPQMDFTRLCQLLTRAEESVRVHLLSALAPRMRRIALAEVEAMSPISDMAFADLEGELMALARDVIGGNG